MHEIALATELSYDVHIIGGLVDIEQLYNISVLNLLHDLYLLLDVL
jgi:hypothetical protein